MQIYFCSDAIAVGVSTSNARTCASVYVSGRAGYGCDPVVWCSRISRRDVSDEGRRPCRYPVPDIFPVLLRFFVYMNFVKQ